jgi:hypothetical protein
MVDKALHLALHNSRAVQEYISVGKGRDVGFDQINGFEAKVSGVPSVVSVLCHEQIPHA